MSDTIVTTNGYTILDDVYTPGEVQAITQAIADADGSRPSFRQTADLFAIRQFLKEIPGIRPLIFTPRLNALITDHCGSGYFPVKQDHHAVQPPLAILENMYTIRIHLDYTDEANGALRVLPGSHLKGIWRYSAEGNSGGEEICRVKSGGVMIMRPLLQHASRRSTGGLRRRVIHLEFSDARLPEGLEWAEIIKSYF